MRALLLVGVLLLAVALLVGPARAATGTVTLSSSGPAPQTITVNRGDSVRFVNQDNGNHTITSNAGAWTFRAVIAPGASATTPAFRSAGSFGYSDVWFITVVQQNANGSVTVRAPAPSPTPKPTATHSPSPKPSATRSPTPRATTTSPTPSPTVSPSGLAIGPPIGGLPSITPSAGPTPNVAPPGSSSATPAAVAYGPKSEIAQSSVHKYGLPVLLALFAAVGVLSLLLRVLLVEAPAVRRTGEVGPEARL